MISALMLLGPRALVSWTLATPMPVEDMFLCNAREKSCEINAPKFAVAVEASQKKSHISTGLMVHQTNESFSDASDKTRMHVPCPCQACQKHREYAKLHPEKHNANMRAYYYRHHDAILLRKAYQRYA
jgi:hypothetical protein